jgi:hypothetical protein
MSDIDKIQDKTIKKAFEHKQMTLEFFDQHLFDYNLFAAASTFFLTSSHSSQNIKSEIQFKTHNIVIDELIYLLLE